MLSSTTPTRALARLVKLKLALPALVGLLTLLSPTSSYAWWNDLWAMRQKIVINASGQVAPAPEQTPAGVQISEPIGTAPVLVRLHAGNFKFDQAKENGADLQFIAADDKTPLTYQIEKYDAALKEALIWVKVPDIKPGARTEFWMYSGNKNAPAIPPRQAQEVYDLDTVLVYHFGERSGPANDATRWLNHAQGSGQYIEGFIGGSLKLTGQPLTIPGAPAAASLSWTDAAPLTWSAWVKLETPQANSVIYSRRNLASGLVIGVDNNLPFVEVASGTGVSRATSATAIDTGKWAHLAVVADGAQIILYVNGVATATLSGTLPALSGVAYLGGDTPVASPAEQQSTAQPADAAAAQTPAEGTGSTGQEGAPAAGTGEPATTPDAATTTDGSTPTTAATQAPAVNPGFIGAIDELTIAKVARPAGFIKAAAIGQGGPQMAQFILYGAGEKNSSWFTGYLGVLLKSVTVDGWVVIFLLAIMMVFSWAVMVSKFRSVGRQARANNLFTERFKRLTADLSMIDRNEDIAIIGQTNGKVTRTDRFMMHNSSLFHLYKVGAEEIRHRMQDPKRPHEISASALAAVRSTLDGVLVREIQKLRARMIVLTIAISGGPFLGLLGTVLGVMITFASIALSGDVNVNSIAPGIAGALVATVAGLAVAIPALFGYNLLIIRINNLTADMQAFVDEFISRIAEYYADRNNHHRLEAAE